MSGVDSFVPSASSRRHSSPGGRSSDLRAEHPSASCSPKSAPRVYEARTDLEVGGGLLAGVLAVGGELLQRDLDPLGREPTGT